MSIFLTLEFKLKDGSLSKSLKWFGEKLPETRAWSGCIGVQTLATEDGKSVLQVQEWETKKHQQAYFKDRAESGIIDEVMQFLTEPPIATYYEKRSE